MYYGEESDSDESYDGIEEWDTEEDYEDLRQDLDWQMSYEGRRILAAEHDALMIRIEEEDLLQAVGILFQKAEAKYQEEEDKEKALKSVRYLFKEI
jgi:hypothetical protein